MSNEIKVGDWTLTADGIDRLEDLRIRGKFAQRQLDGWSRECCEILGVDPADESLAPDFAKEIVLHGTPPMEAIAKIQKHLESQHSANFS